MEAPENENVVWIIKPAAAYCGKGINLYRSGQELPEEVKAAKGVACRYIDPPYLINGLKSDIRLYVLVRARPPVSAAAASAIQHRASPPLRPPPHTHTRGRGTWQVTSWHPLVVYLYDEGLARFATEPYSLEHIERRCMHLTNYSLNKHNKRFVPNTDVTQAPAPRPRRTRTRRALGVPALHAAIARARLRRPRTAARRPAPAS